MRTPLDLNCRSSPRFLAYIVALIVILSLSMTTAGRAAPSAKSTPATVEIGLVGKVSEDSTLPRRITSWFDRRRFRVSTRTVKQLDASRILSPEQQGIVYVWITFGTNNDARLYFATTRRSGREPTYLIRDLQLPQGLDEMGAERIAQVLYPSTVAILEGQADTQREEVERTLKTDTAANAKQDQNPPGAPIADGVSVKGQSPISTPAPSEGVAFRAIDVGLGYGVSFRSDEGIWHGPRASFELSLTQSIGVGGFVRTALPHSQGVEGITLSVWGATLGAFGGWQAPISPSLALEIFAGPGFDVVYQRPTQARNPDATLATGDSEVRPNVITGVGVVLGRAFPRFAFTFDVTFLLYGTRYELINDRSRHTSARAAELSPSLGAELRF